jgi:hypothetical protein
MSLKNQKFPVLDALAMACAIYRENGYTSTSTYLENDPDGNQRWNNREHLSYQMMPSLITPPYSCLFKVTRKDVDLAGEIIKYFRKLSFGVIGDTLNDYMARVFKVTQNPEVTASDFGVLASVPQVYEKEVTEKVIKEEISKTVQAHFGEVGYTIELNIRYIRTKFIQKLNCYGHEAITDTNYLVSFLSQNKLGEPGTVQTIKARIKRHGENYTSKTPETQLNYVKIVDKDFVWQ